MSFKLVHCVLLFWPCFLIAGIKTNNVQGAHGTPYRNSGVGCAVRTFWNMKRAPKMRRLISCYLPLATFDWRQPLAADAVSGRFNFAGEQVSNCSTVRTSTRLTFWVASRETRSSAECAQ